jgi:Ca-activated chloride channel family protein
LKNQKAGLVGVELARPLWLLLLGVLPLWWWWVRPKAEWGLLVARGEESGAVALQRWLGEAIEAAPRLLRAGAIACLILALCHPQWIRTYQERINEGVGIAFAIDLSTSMRAQDMAEGTNRLQAAKATILRFLAKRSDEVGLIAFSGEALTRLPLTRDRYVAESTVAALELGLLTDGTDIAGAIAAAGGLLRDAPHRSRLLILVTDGAHNKAGLEPARAAAAAAVYGVRVYAIALGSEKGSQESIGPGGPDMETVLTQAARITGGQYFRATDVAALDRIYGEIDQLAGGSSVRLVERTASVPITPWLLSISLVLLVGGAAVRASRWGVIP